jgi:hypothetical protein
MRSRRQPVHDRLGSTAARIAASPKSMPTAKEFPMRDRTIDALPVSAADALSRRRSLIALCGVALAAAVGIPAPARAGKAGKKSKKKCRRQIGQCESSVKAFCVAPLLIGPTECETLLLPCCQSFAGCHAGNAYQCFVDIFSLAAQR